MLQFESAVRSAEPFCTYSPHIVEIAILRQESRVSWWHDRIAFWSDREYFDQTKGGAGNSITGLSDCSGFVIDLYMTSKGIL